jgi:co-chaperonin GroES (HSP10)
MLTMKNQKLLVKKLPPPKQVEGILTTTDQTQEVYDAEVVAHGAESEYKTGDIVVMSQYAGEDVVVEGKPYYILDEGNVWALKKR